MLGDVLIGEKPLPCSGPIILSHQISGERRETGQTSQFCLLPGNVWIYTVSCVTVFSLIRVLGGGAMEETT